MKKMKKQFIIITSISKPTFAVKKFSKEKNWNLIVVGDKKTPKNWQQNNCHFISLKEQGENHYNLSKKLPLNHYGRKMIGYLYAIERGADIIADSDDDNIPLKNWGFLPTDGKIETLSGVDFINIYKYFSDEFIWPRGYPLENILDKKSPKKSRSFVKVGVWQFLANKEPDVDAIYRLIFNKKIIFKKRSPMALQKNSICPINSQNTFFIKKFFPLLYLPSFVSFRFTDILRGLVAQPILWNYGYNVGFAEATVYQKRNPHDYMKDFESEIDMYLDTKKIIKLVKKSIRKNASIEENILNAYKELLKHNIVESSEISLLRTWLKDLKQIENENRNNSK